MKRSLQIIFVIIVLFGISSYVSSYVCPAMYQEPTSVKAIPSKYEKLEISKISERSNKLQKKTSKGALKKSKRKFPSKRSR